MVDWFALAELTGNPVWKETVKTRGSIIPDENTFQVSQWLVAWPTAFRLEVLRHMTLEQQRFLIK
ncbi:hypothetical protein QFZ81_001476 [Paenibacillus sp. V4I9]|uniref:hypothetical protein n=1 Tax=Paenibacillus sp. V4I9 TaxID=3042308 RepID=UPI00277F5B1D|nr:hypothetical protein [Paenibacillus sp. V4I9]MDQ0886388.1 hypothetical protein [Paenibacillus sp. V4I9]